MNRWSVPFGLNGRWRYYNRKRQQTVKSIPNQNCSITNAAEYGGGSENAFSAATNLA
jgi:hypothetical protein